MRYVCSDLHGEYDLFCAGLKAIGFSDRDVLYVCGDVMDKGERSVKLLNEVRSRANIKCIMGNHEWSYVSDARSYRESGMTEREVVEKLRERFLFDAGEFTEESLRYLEKLPLFIEGEDFVCVHAGAPVKEGKLTPLQDAMPERFLFDRRFKEPDLYFEGKCVFFGHTPTRYIYNKDTVVAYKKRGIAEAKSLKDYYKVHLDTGSYLSHVVAFFNMDERKVMYVRKSE